MLDSLEKLLGSPAARAVGWGLAVLLALSSFVVAQPPDPPGTAVMWLEMDLPADREPTAADLVITVAPGTSEETVQTVPVTVPMEMRTKTSEGTVWRYELVAEGYWSPPLLVVAETREQPLQLFLYPAGTVAGRMVAPKGMEPPTELALRVETGADAPKAQQDRKVPRATVHCPVSEGAFSCRIPAGELDLRVAAEGFVPHYRWGLRVAEGKAVDLGKLRLETGGSLMGRVEADPKALEETPAQVQLELARAGHPLGKAEAEKAQRRALEVQTDAEGYFQLVGLTEGEYRLVATHPTAGRGTEFPISVVQGRETELPVPVVLHPPTRIRVESHPPTDAQLQPWRVEVMEVNQAGTAAWSRQQGRVGEDGTWESPPLTAGRYLVSVGSSGGSWWLREAVRLRGRDETVVFLPELVQVEGRVFFDDLPIAAQLWFGGRRGMVSIEVQADEEGEFSGLLPRAGDWRVEIATREPAVQKTQKIRVPEPEDARPVQVEIRLAGGQVEGEVVNERGEPAPRALVFLSEVSEDFASPQQAFTDEKGEFVFSSVERGTHTLQAYRVSPEAWEASGEASVEVAVDEAVPFQRLELVSRHRIRGTVASPAGPVSGAGVVVGLSGAGAQILPEAQTDVEGRFVLDLPPDLPEVPVTASPPGFAFTCTRMWLSGGDEITIPVQSLGGTLRVGGDEDLTSEVLLTRMAVRQNGLRCSISALRQWAAVYGFDSDPAELALHKLAPGQYEVCLPGSQGQSRPQCRDGWLPPGGELALSFGSGAAASPTD